MSLILDLTCPLFDTGTDALEWLLSATGVCEEIGGYAFAFIPNITRIPAVL
jgi:hypothetical protein